jgi:CHASE2 domain-containing sensor protein/predicted Ser/Thr protein kinase
MGLFKKLRGSFVKDNHAANSVVNGQSNGLVVQNNTLLGKLSLVVATSVGVTALLVGIRHNALLQPWELNAYDQMLRSRPIAPPDDRLLLVTVTENDNPLTDATVNKLLVKLESYKPRVIGINIPLSQQSNFADGVVNKNNIISICKFEDLKTPEIPPPKNVLINTVGFNNLMSDNSGRILRRSLLFADPHGGKCKTHYSFAAQLVLNYLEKQGIKEDFSNPDQNLVLGKAVLPRLRKTSGSYENLDNGGYQVMINYSNPDVVRERQIVTVSAVLNDQIDASAVNDKLVIIGSIAASNNQGAYTPYSELINQPIERPRLFIHAQVASQLLSAALDGKQMISYWPDNAEIAWMWLWALAGGILAWRIRNPVLFISGFGIGLCGLVGICYVLFLQAWWIPVVPPALGFMVSSITVVAYTAYRSQVRTRVIILQVEKQQEAIAQLSALLKETSRLPGTNANTVDTVEKKSGDFLLGGRYQINRVLGSGGFGCTYLAKDAQRPGNPTVVVKQLMPARRDTRFMEVARRLFDAEAEILLILGKHIQIPDLLAYFEENNEFYLVQEYIKGRLLTQELSSTNTVKDEAFTIEMLKSVLQVLKFVHEHRVIHRDIKPDNIIRNSQDNRLVLIDFGAVKTMQPANSEKTELATVAIGTKGYAPPEQLAGHPRLASDIYALGMIAIQAVTGTQPQLLSINPDTGNVEWRKMAQISDELAAILDKMVCYHFSDRYQSAPAVLEDLNRINN